MTVFANPSSSVRPAGQLPADEPDPATQTAIAVDLGSSAIGVWVSHRGAVSGPCGDAYASAGTLVRRGRIVDVAGCATLLSQLIRGYREPVPAGGIVAACRPVLAGEPDQATMRQVIETVFVPSRLVFIDTVRAAAIGSGAAAGALLVVDAGAQLTETALLKNGHVVSARRADIGTRDLVLGATVDLIGDIVGRHVDDLRRSTDTADLASARTRGMLLVGDGATHPDLAATLSVALRIPVHRAPAPRTAALNGAGLAARSLLRHPAQT